MFQFTHPRGVRHLHPDCNLRVLPRFNSRTHAGATFAGYTLDVPRRMFQFTHPRGVRLTVWTPARVFAEFQFTHPRGVRQRNIGKESNTELFQFTHPRGVRHQAGQDCGRCSIVSIHAPTRGADGYWGRISLYRLSFNSRTHAGCDAMQDKIEDTNKVSIHAPTRGATRCRTKSRIPTRFQFTHPRGVRRRTSGTALLRLVCFNSRTHAGCDPSLDGYRVMEDEFQFTHPRGVRQTATVSEPTPTPVSIHAPTRGATSCRRVRCRWSRGFQFTHPRGVRLEIPLSSCFLLTVSIHAPTRGATQIKSNVNISMIMFQFTHPRGVRHREVRKQLRSMQVSIHAPTRGATSPARCSNASDDLFQFTHPRGVRLESAASSSSRARFQFTHPRGVRHVPHCIYYIPRRVSIHAPTRGATLSGQFLHGICQVSIHAPTRGATNSTSGCRRKHSGFNSRTHAGCDTSAMTMRC